MLMPGRTYSATSGYRYGFNGKEQDSSINGNGVDYDYGMRIYDARIARFLSEDPLRNKFPMLTPYQFASNSPEANVDLDGQEAKYYTISTTTIITTVGSGKGAFSFSSTKENTSENFEMENKGAGLLGKGTLIVSTSRTVMQHYDSKLHKTIVTKDVVVQTQSVYIPPPPVDGSMANSFFNIMIFGSGDNPDYSPGSHPNPNAYILTLNYKEFMSIINLSMQGMSVPDLKKINATTLPGLADKWRKIKEYQHTNPINGDSKGNGFAPNQQYIIYDPAKNLPSNIGYAGSIYRKSVRTDSMGKIKDTIYEYNPDCSCWPNAHTPENDTVPTKGPRK